MSCQLAPLLVEISITPPSNALAALASNENRWVNEIVTGPVPATSGGDSTLASVGSAMSLPNTKPSSADLRLWAQMPLLPDGFHAKPPASNVSVAELWARSSV